MKIKNIVVPYDFSERCRAAAVHAAALAHRFDASLTLLHVIPYSSFEYAAFEGGAYTGTLWPSEEEVVARLRTEAQEIPVSDEAKKTWKFEALKGEPPLRIAQFVSQLESPLLVMPTHGHGAFRRFVLGSVTAKTLHDVNCPVLTGAHLENAPDFGGEAYERIACALDLTESSEQTLRFAMDFAKAWNATLTVVHASPWLIGADTEDGLLPESMRRRLLDASKGEAVALLRAVGCDADLRVGFGRPEDFVPATVREIDAQMLIIGRHSGKDGVGFGAHCYGLVRSSPCPVLSV